LPLASFVFCLLLPESSQLFRCQFPEWFLCSALELSPGCFTDRPASTGEESPQLWGDHLTAYTVKESPLKVAERCVKINLDHA
jgi:hypothetical protein